MVPIELVWFIVVALFGLIGFVRGYLKELGVTTVVVVVLFGMITAEGRVLPLLSRVFKSMQPGEVAFWQSVLWAVGLAATGLVSYHGQILAFEGTLPKGALGTTLNLTSGLVNGYLIAGSIWFYVNRSGYPLMGIKPENLSALANGLLKLMPPCLLGPYLLYVGVFLVLMRVIR